MTTATSPVKALGEIALRVENLDEMQRFYEDVIGLTLMKRFDNSAFFKIADGHAGHTQIPALFDRTDRAGYRGLDPTRTTLTTSPLPSTWPITTRNGNVWRLRGL